MAAESGSSTKNPLYAQGLRRRRQQREVERVCKIPRLVAELLAEIGRVHGIEDDIAARLEKFAGLDAELLRAIGADVFPAAPLFALEGGQ